MYSIRAVKSPMFLFCIQQTARAAAACRTTTGAYTVQRRVAYESLRTVRSTLSPKESDHHCVGRTCGLDLAHTTTTRCADIQLYDNVPLSRKSDM